MPRQRPVTRQATHQVISRELKQRQGNRKLRLTSGQKATIQRRTSTATTAKQS